MSMMVELLSDLQNAPLTMYLLGHTVDPHISIFGPAARGGKDEEIPYGFTDQMIREIRDGEILIDEYPSPSLIGAIRLEPRYISYLFGEGTSALPLLIHMARVGIVSNHVYDTIYRMSTWKISDHNRSDIGRVITDLGLPDIEEYRKNLVSSKHSREVKGFLEQLAYSYN